MAEAVAPALSSMSRDRLVEVAEKAVRGYQSIRGSMARLKERGEKPAIAIATLAGGFGGAALSGVIRGFVPTTHRFRAYDAALGGAICVCSLFGAGSTAGDAAALFGLGLAAPGLSHFVEGKIQAKRAKP